MKVNYSSFLKVFIYSLLFFVMIDPVGSLFHMKETSFIATVFVATLYILHNKLFHVNIFSFSIILFFIFLPIYGILVANISSSFVNPEFAYGQVKSFMFILLLPILCLFDKNFLMKSIVVFGTIISIIIILIYVISSLYPVLSVLIYNFFVLQYDLALISNREFLGIEVYAVFYRTAPVIVFSLSYFLYAKTKYSTALSVLNFFGLLFTGSRTPILVGFLILFIGLNDKIKSKTVKYGALFTSIVIITFMVFSLASEKNESSSEIKLGNYHSYVENIFSGANLITGSGLGSEFYAAGNNTYITSSELTYLDIIRIYGIPLGLFTILIVFFPFLQTFRKRSGNILRRRFMLAYALYMVIAGTNPLLISSTGIYVLCLGWAIILPQNNQIFYENKRLYSDI